MHGAISKGGVLWKIYVINIIISFLSVLIFITDSGGTKLHFEFKFLSQLKFERNFQVYLII